MVEFDTLKVKEQLGRPEDKRLDVIRKDDTLVLESGPLIVETNNLGEAWIVGSATNGLVGANTSTASGNQQVVGGSGRFTTMRRVTNPDNQFREHFRDTEFLESVTGGVVWNTTLFRVEMSSSNNHTVMYSGFANFKRVFYNVETVLRCLLSVTETKFGTDVINWQASADGKSNWEDITVGVEHIFTNTGQDLYLRAHFLGNGGSSTYFEDLYLSYEVAV